MTVHACPVEGTGTMPCCGKSPLDVPRTHRMTVHGPMVTCGKEPDGPVEDTKVWEW